VAAAVKRRAGIKGDLDHYLALGFLRGLLAILSDAGNHGLLLVLDEVDKLRHLLRSLHGADQPAHIPGVFRDALERRRFRYVLMMTARPIHNGLWDLYYLIDLLTAARGHTNPLGSENAFALKFIADKRDEARALKPQAQEEFHAIMSRYISRIRRE